ASRTTQRQGRASASGHAPARAWFLGALGTGLDYQDLRQRLPDQFRHPPRFQSLDLGAAVRDRLHGVLAQPLFRGVFTADEDGVELGTAADIFVQAQFPLHSGRIVGLFGRILISIMGLVVAALSVTGVVIWWRKRRARVRVRETAAVRLSRQLTPAE